MDNDEEHLHNAAPPACFCFTTFLNGHRMMVLDETSVAIASCTIYNMNILNKKCCAGLEREQTDLTDCSPLFAILHIKLVVYGDATLGLGKRQWYRVDRRRPSAKTAPSHYGTPARTLIKLIISNAFRLCLLACTIYIGWVDPDPNNQESPVKPPFLDWCSPYKNWRQVCSYNPYEGVPSELHHLLHGGETNLWSELTDSVTLDSRLWAQAAAAAETLWVGPGKMDEQTTRRLAEFRERLVL